MNRLCFRPFAALFLLSVLPLSAQVSLTGGGYVENFDGMGTGTAPPVGWGFWGALGGDANTWSNAVGVLTTGTGNMTGGTQNNVLSPATTFATNSNTAGFNYALSTSTADRALGGAPTTGSGVALELSLTNGTGATVNAIQVSYLIRRFTAPATANELPGFWLFYNVNGAGWVNVPALNPTVAGPAGVIVPNTTGVTTVPATSVGLNTPWTSGSTLRLRWVDDNATNTSPDQIVGLDNVSIQVSQPPPVVTLTAPAAGSLFAPSAVVPMTADATDDGAVTKVEFFAGGTKVGEDTTAPYAFNWTPASPGTYSLTAVATDNFGSTTTSAAVGITALGAADVVSFTGSRYFQTFNGLGVTPPASTVTPSGWSFVGALGGSSTTWTDALGVLTTGTGNMSGGTATTALTLMPAALNSASNTNGFNIGVTDTDLDRALGTSPTGGSGVILQLTLTNNTGTDLNDVALSYLIRRFTAPATANELPGYWLFYSLGSGPWTNVSALNPSVSGPGGVVIPSTAGTTTVPLTIVNLATPWTSGALLRFRWVDDNAVTSPEQILGIDDVAVQLNQPAPVVTLTAPANGASIQMPGPVTITADATDNSAVTKVEFFAGSTKVGEDTSAPYAFDWMPALSGTYLLTAVATDDSGATATSAPVSVQVFNPNNIPPQAVVISPAAGTSVPASSLTVLASASDTDGYITKVAFYCNGVKEGEVTGEPYLFTIPSISAGPLTLTVEATDNDGGTTVSAPVAVNALAFSNTELISRGAVWSYWDKGTDLGTAWKEVNYVEPEPWSSGPAEFGYGDAPVTVLQQGPDGTVSSSKFITYYFRRTFTIADVSQVFSLAATLERDDGALIYLNGQEVARSNMPTFEVNYLTGASTAVSGTDETTYFPITLPVSALVNGTNVIAVEVHQNANNSSDLSFDMDLTATVA
ncbi:MAG TPA: Ig-like domain-containing protein, partial [Verrucomicrobiales bacterium]|nr:Ig-like domain-containing protein [Verrucomicrobiales bacterium]